MKKYINLILAAVIIFIIFAGIMTGISIKKKNKEIITLKNNIKVLTYEIDTVRNNESQCVVKVPVYVSNTKELNNAKSEISKYKKEVELLGLKLRNAENIIDIQYKTIGDMKAQIDTMYTLGGEGEDFTYSKFNDGYYNCILNGSNLKCTYQDTMIASLNRYKTGFFLFRPFKAWKYQLNAKFSNPRSSIIYSRYIEIR